MVSLRTPLTREKVRTRESMALPGPIILALLALTLLITVARGTRDTSQAAKRQKANHMRRWQRQNAGKTAAHLIGVPSSFGHTLRWDSKNDVAFTRHEVQYKHSKLMVERNGLYYVYCQVGFHGTDSSITVSNEVYVYHDSYPESRVLLTGTDSLTGPPSGSKLWYASLGQGGLASLETGHLLYVNVSHPSLVDYSNGMTFFGLLLVS